MKKRGRKVLLVSVAALVVALVALALVFREQSPHEFLRGAKRWKTEIVYDGRYVARIFYVVDFETAGAADKALKELKPKGWIGSSGHSLSAPGGWDQNRLSQSINVYSGDMYQTKAWLQGKSVVMVSRSPRAMDRFNAWLDRLRTKSGTP